MTKRLDGFNIFASAGSLFVSRRHDEDPIARQLRQIGLDRTDAHHVMIAIQNGCDALVTSDQATILKYRRAVEAQFAIRLMRPSEFVQRFTRPAGR